MTIRVNTYAIVARAVEEGVAAGWRRDEKHGPASQAVIIEAITWAVLMDLCDVLVFGETGAIDTHTSESSAGRDATSAPSSSDVLDVPLSRAAGAPGRIRGPRRSGV